jgi:hypothetical protein
MVSEGKDVRDGYTDETYSAMGTHIFQPLQSNSNNSVGIYFMNRFQKYKNAYIRVCLHDFNLYRSFNSFNYSIS